MKHLIYSYLCPFKNSHKTATDEFEFKLILYFANVILKSIVNRISSHFTCLTQTVDHITVISRITLGKFTIISTLTSQRIAHFY